jgi:hypothetical protein
MKPVVITSRNNQKVWIQPGCGCQRPGKEYKVIIEGFRRDMEGLPESFKLNAGQLEMAVRQIVRKDWAAVRGAWVPGQGGEPVLPWAGDGDYADKLTQLCNNLSDYYHRHAERYMSVNKGMGKLFASIYRD